MFLWSRRKLYDLNYGDCAKTEKYQKLIFSPFPCEYVLESFRLHEKARQYEKIFLHEVILTLSSNLFVENGVFVIKLFKFFCVMFFIFTYL